MHWLLAVEFKDDLSRYRTGHGAKNMVFVRRFALDLVRSTKTKGSIKTRRTRRMEPGISAPGSTDCTLTWIPCRGSCGIVHCLSSSLLIIFDSKFAIWVAR
jgi:hypothetical protein